MCSVKETIFILENLPNSTVSLTLGAAANSSPQNLLQAEERGRELSSSWSCQGATCWSDEEFFCHPSQDEVEDL